MMEPRFTHNCHHHRTTICPACFQNTVRNDVDIQEEALVNELTVMWLREDQGPQMVHAILSGSENGLRMYDEIRTKAEGLT